MCKFCESNSVILKSEIDFLGSSYLMSSVNKEREIKIKEVDNMIETDKVRVYYDRGYLRLTLGDDIGCLDHSEDMIKANFCFNCGNKMLI